ncbi:anhydro-N-acetylmuramic acid kinase [Aquabacterium sp.]|uniref:anhydro-N-acetylmuramic acid kinase n=1 Tax=Aquabacterium sp. TaxID=1872578 RepID=UPI002C014E37|nr:anhydro-N-acetylmuramic acid kinase [Aquabacterium sp.]HSW06835.1 anhydro-N-acetylmuramic acid kinase [Aquabacterium sp.]
MRLLFVGLMSGTSLDGVDAVLAAFEDGAPLRVLAHHHLPMPASLQPQLLALNAAGHDELHHAALASNAIARLYADAVRQLLAKAGVPAADLRAVGAHGQTVRHRPQAFDGTGYTLQLLNGALLAELCGIDVVCDFRSRDVAAGGQGAPLVPAFHAACFAGPGQAQAVLNIGGIANLSLLHADGRVGGFDCGPGNALMDQWCQQHRGQPFDHDGAWAASGQVHAGLLAQWLAEPFFDQPPPKSTGRDLFHAGWLAAGLAALPTIAAEDVQATLAELTARSCAAALRRHADATTRLLVCGGGALNGHLMRRLAALLPGVQVASTDTAGLPPLQVEAAAFAWLAHAFIELRPGNRPEVTGAAGLRVLGALHPA